ncbi:MAG TPA: TIGR00730 family Rossman fold protein [Tepidisphaeraceae bacterium]
MHNNRHQKLIRDGLAPDSKDVWRIFRIMSEFVEGFEEMASIGPAVSIFGSARTRPDDPYYKAAEQTARLLVKEQFAVITGGGPGIMEAANKGAFEAGGKSIGLNITLPEEQEANRYQTLSLDFHYFYARKVMFVKYASAFVCFPGGYGTLDEFFETMTLIQTLKIEAFPIILYGSDHWGGLAEWLRRQLIPRYVDSEDLDIFKIVDTPQEVVKLVHKGVKHHWWKPLDAELTKIAGNGSAKKRGPLSGERSAGTGEGTRYGKRPKRSEAAHAKASRKPQQ